MADRPDRYGRRRPVMILTPDIVARPAPTPIVPDYGSPYDPSGSIFSPDVTTPTEPSAVAPIVPDYGDPYNPARSVFAEPQPANPLEATVDAAGVPESSWSEWFKENFPGTSELVAGEQKSHPVEDAWEWFKKQFSGGEEEPDKKKPDEKKTTDTPIIAAPPAPTDGSGGAAGMSLEQYLQFLEQLYGDQTYANPAQDRADAEAQRMQGRTAMLAQLALAGGMAKGAGQAWEGMGQGFLDAASVYDRGFSRYQSALQNSADRYARDLTRQQTLGLAKKNAALQLWSAERSDIRTEARAAAKEGRSRIDKYYETLLTAYKDSAEPETLTKIAKVWQEAVARNEIIPIENLGIDVADT